MTRAALDAIVMGQGLQALVADGSITLEGDRAPVQALIANLDTFEFWFPIVTP
jgi:alkyl sulfatase BDS1-like metallo-beta-lactamase superfamily hydrolase